MATIRTRTKYPKNVKQPAPNMLKPGRKNAKLGHRVSVGVWKGMVLWQLSLEERVTCPRTCDQWDDCYGNNMPFAYRYDHTADDFIEMLSMSLADKQKRHPNGFVVRLHVLGDFFSVAYVQQWAKWLDEFPALHVYGYTHHHPDSDIGRALSELNKSSKWKVRFSDAQDMIFSANVIPIRREAKKGIEVICPEQLGQTDKCTSCGLCWSQQERSILFLKH